MWLCSYQLSAISSQTKGLSAQSVFRLARFVAVLVLAIGAGAQESGTPDPFAISTKDLPAGTLWNPYSFRLQAAGGVGPYHWRVVSGSLPHELKFRESGEISGVVNQQGTFEFTLQVEDGSSSRTKPKKLTLTIENPLSAVWLHKARVNGQRIDGSIKVSNTSGRDFDLTFIVLAVNDIGRATAIGYQHFPLKANTKDLEIPFGDTLSFGDYAVHVDVVGEEPVSNMIFRTRLVTEKQAITQGP